MQCEITQDRRYGAIVPAMPFSRVSIVPFYYIAQGFPPEPGIEFRVSGVGGMGYGLCEAWIVIQTGKGKERWRKGRGKGE